jgi:predicted RNase H-like HicB family nuclease
LRADTATSILQDQQLMTDSRAEAEHYLILVEGGPPSNYSAWSPDLPGCVATGHTLEEVEREMREAIAFHLEGLAADGLPLPEPSGPGVYLAA